MKAANDISELIGGTPLVRLNRIFPGDANSYFAKLELMNPASSVKERPARGMIDEAERQGLLKPGSTIIEATSGNTGIALAMIAAARGYRIIITMPETMGVERQSLLKLFGAQVELTPAPLGMRGALQRAEQLHEEIPGSFYVRQFENCANPRAHEDTTAEEIWRDTDGNIDVVVGGVGTGGTITGIARRLKQHKPELRVVAAEPDSSAILSGGPPGPHMIQGIGAGFIPGVLDQTLLDAVVRVTDREALTWTHKIIREEGIMAGISSGAAACAAAKYQADRPSNGAHVVIIFPDTGERCLNLLTAMLGRA